MNGLDFILAFLSVACFGAAFFIASKPVARAKESGLHSQQWQELEKHKNGRAKPDEVLTALHDETQ